MVRNGRSQRQLNAPLMPRGRRGHSLLNVSSASSAPVSERSLAMAAVVAVAFILVAFAALGAVVVGVSRL